MKEEKSNAIGYIYNKNENLINSRFSKDFFNRSLKNNTRDFLSEIHYRVEMINNATDIVRSLEIKKHSSLTGLGGKLLKSIICRDIISNFCSIVDGDKNSLSIKFSFNKNRTKVRIDKDRLKKLLPGIENSILEVIKDCLEIVFNKNISIFIKIWNTRNERISHSGVAYFNIDNKRHIVSRYFPKLKILKMAQAVHYIFIYLIFFEGINTEDFKRRNLKMIKELF